MDLHGDVADYSLDAIDASLQLRHPALMSDCAAIVGLHPDQASEAIVDAALALGKPFAVVPCCVFPSTFPQRRLRSGQHVRTYRGFLKYLRAKHPDIETARLPFEGRNRVVFWRGPQLEATGGRSHTGEHEHDRRGCPAAPWP